MAGVVLIVVGGLAYFAFANRMQIKEIKLHEAQ